MWLETTYPSNIRRMVLLRKIAHGLLFLATMTAAQEIPDNLPGKQGASGRKSPSVSMSPSPIATVTRGKPNTVNLRFRVSTGFHVNSNQPKSEFLIPTVLKLNAPTDIIVGRVGYPAGEEMSFAFAPDDKLSVYTGEFPLSVEVRPLAGVIPGKYMIHGELRYQACDNAACYPPKKLPVEFEVKIVKSPPPRRKNPGQSPHVHT
jgi:Disulphide bond corrector protein DsbC